MLVIVVHRQELSGIGLLVDSLHALAGVVLSGIVTACSEREGFREQSSLDPHVVCIVHGVFNSDLPSTSGRQPSTTAMACNVLRASWTSLTNNLKEFCLSVALRGAESGQVGNFYSNMYVYVDTQIYV